MPASDDPWRPDLSDRVTRLKPYQKVGNVPTAVMVRAEQLCGLIDDADGIRTDRQTLIAALIYAAAEDGHRLAEIWQEYRTAPVHRLLIGQENQSGEVDLRALMDAAKADTE